MSWIVNWNGKDYDVDPTEFSGQEMKQIKLVTGFTFSQLMNGIIREQDGDAICAIFWIVDRRDNPELKFSDYPGPPLKVILPRLGALGEVVEELGKGMDSHGPTETNGGPSSSSGADSPAEPTLML